MMMRPTLPGHMDDLAWAKMMMVMMVMMMVMMVMMITPALFKSFAGSYG